MTEPDQDPTPPSPPSPPATGRRASTDRRSRPRRRRGGISIVGVLGELLITAGVLVLLFLGWQQWLNNIIVGNEVRQQAVQQSREWDKGGAVAKPTDPAAPPVLSVAPANAQRFAYLIVPRFGADYYRPIAQGIGVKDVLNKGELGHYPTTQMPGALGNFAIASHRHAYGGNLLDENKLQVGDHVFVETQDGWYQYSFRNLQYVKPTGVGVLDPVPEQSGVAPTERFITLTTCNPLFSTAERMIAYGTFDKFYPRAGGPPAEIAATVNGKA